MSEIVRRILGIKSEKKVKLEDVKIDGWMDEWGIRKC